LKIEVVGTEHQGTVFGEPIFLEPDALETVDRCPVCTSIDEVSCVGTSEARLGVTLALHRCASCGHVYLGRRPSRAWYQGYYARHWDTGRDRSDAGPGPGRRWDSLRQRIRQIPGVRRSWRSLHAALREEARRPDRDMRSEEVLCMLAGLGSASRIKGLPSGGSVLELGAGHGGALTAFQEAGFVAVGTEASAYRAQGCREQGLDVVQTPIDDVSPVAERGPFDFIYSSHVVEHLLDPAKTLAQAVGLLRDGGYVYLEVPHSSAAESLLKLLHYPFHCHCFSLSSMAALMARLDLALVRIHADVNLHVVAQKAARGFDFPDPSVTDDRWRLLRGEGRWLETEGRIVFHFDDWHVRIERPGEGILYDRPAPYATRRFDPERPSPLGRTFLLDVRRDEDEGLWPVRWIHPTDRAPIWMKFQ